METLGNIVQLLWYQVQGGRGSSDQRPEDKEAQGGRLATKECVGGVSVCMKTLTGLQSPPQIPFFLPPPQ